MSTWEFIIREDVIRSVLPAEYAHFARPVRDGLTLFLERLPESWQADILQQQAALPLAATAGQRLSALARCCPVLHKLGQVLARDQRLCSDLRGHLRELESLTPTVPVDQIQRQLLHELGPLADLGVTLAPPALAEASVAVVVPFRQHCGRDAGSSVDGVFKVLKPGIEERLEKELELLQEVGAHLDLECETLGIPRLDYQDSFQQVREKLGREVRLDLEQRHLTAAHAMYESLPDVHIPRVLAHCTPRVTAMERIYGGKVTDHDLQHAHLRGRLAEIVVEAMIAHPIFSPAGQALFHSDPHAGNLFLTDEGRLAILDWSLAGELGERERRAMVDIMLATITLRTEGIVAALAELSERPEMDVPAVRKIVYKWLRRMRHGQFPGIDWLVGMLDDAVQYAGLRVAADLMLFRKMLHTLQGVITEIRASGFQIDQVLFAEFLRHFALEWPGRWFKPPASRRYATRLSNVDLMRTVLSMPETAARFWLTQSLDFWGVPDGRE
jgi:ubiquinone biosynthesis protein